MTRSDRFRVWATLICCFLLVARAGSGAAQAVESEVIGPPSGLVIGPVGSGGRAPFHTNAIEAAIAAGKWDTPRVGGTLNLPNGGKAAWRAAEAEDDGWFRNVPGRGYLHLTVDSEQARTMLMEVSGNFGFARINGEPRTGDPYGTGWIRLPVELAKGTNTFLFHVYRGSLRMSLMEPPAEVYLDQRDRTYPQLLIGEDEPLWGSLLLVNTRNEPLRNLRLVAYRNGHFAGETEVGPVDPLAVRKVPFRLTGPGPTEAAKSSIRLDVIEGEATLWTEEFELGHADPKDSHTRTFVSAIDGSVQYYAVRPPPLGRPGDGAAKPGLILTLHGAGVEGAGQRNQYAPKDWAYVVAPTNRRPYGFDWEDWGRLDALEVLEHASRRFDVDRQRTWLTGHSMGGHGTWNLGVQFPDRFAAIGPSAGWISFWSYTGAVNYEEDDSIAGIFRRATSASDTLALKDNFKQQAIYILHGERDDNVPVGQARTMVKELADYHQSFVYHEQPGAGHWWGSPCCDWPPMMDLFQRRSIPASDAVNEVEFVTASPGVSATCHWVTVLMQTHPLAHSRIEIERDVATGSFTGTTTNVSRLSLAVIGMPADQPLTIQLDTSDLTIDAIGGGRVFLVRQGNAWRQEPAPPSPALKGPHRYGPFKNAFRNRMVFVYGTNGTHAENDWARTKARLDAETFWYRGNGSIDVIPDSEFVGSAYPDRNVIVYGNRETNSAWDDVLGDCPVQVGRNRVQVGERALIGDNLGGLLVHPRTGSDFALAAAVTGTGVAGFELTTRLPYFVSGVGYPDFCILGPKTLTDAIDGVIVAGFFGEDWKIESGDVAWAADQ